MSSMPCKVCQKFDSASEKCARCKRKSYCSKDCQKTDWPFHNDFVTNLFYIILTSKNESNLIMNIMQVMNLKPERKICEFWPEEKLIKGFHPKLLQSSTRHIIILMLMYIWNHGEKFYRRDLAKALSFFLPLVIDN